MIEQTVAIVTGGAGGMGSALARRFAEDGYAVVIADLDVAAAERVADELRDTGAEAMGVRLDVTDEESAAAMVQSVDERYGRIDVLINNAGLFGNPVWTGRVLDIPFDAWDSVMNVNVKGPLVCARAVVPVMRRARWGRIVNISSQGAYMAAGAYSISKVALNQLTWNLARELGRDRITVNGVGPGTMDLTNTHEMRGAEQMEQTVKRQIVRRLGDPADIYAAIKYFVGNESEYCTAQTLLVNGGALVLL